MPLNPDTQLGRYQIRSQIGAGGMGEVYRAQDIDLDRPVALKILPESLTQDEDRLRRFRQEARAASKLNHPNVAHIYEIGEAGGRHFIAMEYVKGETLRFLMLQANHPLTKILDIAAQVAAALAAAHAHGIVHRDVKPDNVIVQTDGLVKVLDFGLAKVETNSADDTTSTDNASTLIQTSPGMVMGTASYMSPEQARGLKVDARTDIFSLGVVLYEMVTQRKPFEGATTSDVLAALLERTPPPLDQLKPDAPQELERIVTKALEKDAEQRYQTIKDMALDLRKLKQRLEGQSGSAGLLLSDASGGGAMPSPSTPSTIAMRSNAASQPTLVGQARSTSSVEYVVSQINRHKLGAALIAVLVLAVLAAAGFGLFKIISQRQAEALPSFQTMKITKLTTTGKSRNASISPDGKYVAYSAYDGGQASLWVRQVATNSNVQIVSPKADAIYGGLTFSPDGNYIYYVHQEGTSLASVVLYQIPILGGNPRKLLSNVHGSVSFSPDGSRFVFGRWSSDGTESSLIVANADGTGEQVLGTRKGSDYFGGGVASIHPTWSPDGEAIVCSIATTDAGGDYASLVEVRVADGAQKSITSQRWSSVGQAAWLRDGSGLVFVAKNMQSGSPAQIWQLSYPGGEARKITNDTNEYSGVGVTHDSKALVTTQTTSLNSVWVATPNADASHATQVSADNTGEPGISWTPDNRIVYSSRASGNVDVWSMNVDGTHPKQLTFDEHTDVLPTVTPDGRYVVFMSDRAGSYNVWRMDIDGGNSLQLTRGNLDDLATSSRDGRWVIYSSFRSGKATLWKVGIDGGDPVQLTDYTSFGAVVSPDGRLIACIYEQPNESAKVAIIPFEGGQPNQLLELSPTAFGWLRWSPDGRAISFINHVNGIGNIWNLSLNGGALKQLTDFKSDRITQLDWSRDGKQLALMRGTQIRDIVIIRNFK